MVSRQEGQHWFGRAGGKSRLPPAARAGSARRQGAAPIRRARFALALCPCPGPQGLALAHLEQLAHFCGCRRHAGWLLDAV